MKTTITQSVSLASRLRDELFANPGVPLALSMGYVSALREVADDESHEEFQFSRAAYRQIAARLLEMSTFVQDEVQQGYVQVSTLVSRHAESLV